MNKHCSSSDLEYFHFPKMQTCQYLPSPGNPDLITIIAEFSYSETSYKYNHLWHLLFKIIYLRFVNIVTCVSSFLILLSSISLCEYITLPHSLLMDSGIIFSFWLLKIKPLWKKNKLKKKENKATLDICRSQYCGNSFLFSWINTWKQ